jgi:gliding motility-associated-like protein
MRFSIYLFLFVFIFGAHRLDAQCLTNSLVINTGYDPLTGTGITAGLNGGTPVPDPKWIVTFETTSIADAISLTGLIEVVPGANADIITKEPTWVANPVGNPGGWISCLNSNTYTTDGTGPSGTDYHMILTRPFKMCSDDSIKFDVYIANDNLITSSDVDGTDFGFSQTLPLAANFTGYTHYTKTLFLTAGTHNFNLVVKNYNDPFVEDNPTGMNIYGTVASTTGGTPLISESFLSCATFTCSFTCNTISLPDTLHACAGDAILLPATIAGTDSVMSILWSPITGLSSSTILAPTLTVGLTSSYYYITVSSLNPFNLVANGDFEGGNTGFASGYTYRAPPCPILFEGEYSVYTDPFGVHGGFTSFGDHTTGTGNMMIMNGSPTPTDVWCQTIPVTPFTDYDFSAWIANCSSVTVGPDVPTLQFKINGVLIGTPTVISSPPATWVNFFQVWNSGVSTTATICIRDLNTTLAGNDFVLDDITFKEICVAKDSVYIAVKIPDTTADRKDTTLCVSGGPITITGTPGYITYLWNTGATTTSISPAVSGTYWVYCSNNCSVRIDTFNITYVPLPIVSLGNDTAFCIGNDLLLTSIQPPGSTYLWSTSSTATSIIVNTTGTYWLKVDNGYCNATDTIHITVSPFPIVDLGPDILNCSATPVTLQSSVAYTTPTYLWNDGSTASTLIASTTGTYWLQVTVGGCPSADTINVMILYDTFKLSNGDTAICKGNNVQVFLTADPSASFQWLPTAGIANSTIADPLITPDTSALYTVHIYMPGCPDTTASFFIDVQPNPQLYIGGNKSVCQFDSLHLHALVSPQWYTHYTYLWSPGIHLDDSTVPNVIFTPGDSSKIVLTVKTPNGCTGADSAMLIVHPGNFAKLDTAYDLCPYDSVQFTPTGGVSYVWHPGMYLNDSTIPNPWLKAITSHSYMAIATSAFGCKDTVTTTVHIRPAGVLNVGDSVTLYPGESYHVNPQTNCLSFAWFPPAGLSNAYVSDPVITPEISTKYIVHGVTEWGCKAVDSINVYIDLSELLTLPNAFTPGAGVNNKLYILKRGVAKLNYFRIYNRWGNVVYESSNLDQGWDGTFNGKPQPYDVYVYQVEAVSNNGAVFHKHGNVTLIR